MSATVNPMAGACLRNAGTTFTAAQIIDNRHHEHGEAAKAVDRRIAPLFHSGLHLQYPFKRQT